MPLCSQHPAPAEKPAPSIRVYQTRSLASSLGQAKRHFLPEAKDEEGVPTGRLGVHPGGTDGAVGIAHLPKGLRFVVVAAGPPDFVHVLSVFGVVNEDLLRCLGTLGMCLGKADANKGSMAVLLRPSCWFNHLLSRIGGFQRHLQPEKHQMFKHHFLPGTGAKAGTTQFGRLDSSFPGQLSI